MRAVALRTEYRTDPLGIGVRRPRLSWELESPVRGDGQTGYRVVVAGTAAQAATGAGDVWDSGAVPAADTIGIQYDGPALRSGQRCWWTVQVWDAAGDASPWAPVSFWETGLLEAGDWQASWITPPAEVSAPVAPPSGVSLDPGSPLASSFDLGGWRGPRPAYLRKVFSADAPVVSARAYVTARGLYDLHLNGQRVGDDLLRPGWTDYGKRIQYQVYDVGELLRPGANAVALLLGSGWYAGRVAWQDRIYGDTPSALVQLQLTRADGSVELVCSDASWVSAASPLLWSDLLLGECMDASGRVPGWDTVELDDSGWAPVVAVDPPVAPLVAERGPSVRRLRELAPVSVRQQVPGRWTFDLGQNMVGRVRLRVRGGSGRLVVRHAEMLEADGRLHTANLRAALATDLVELDGSDFDYEPHFTTHGFRYVEVSGLAAKPADDFLTGVVLGSDLPEAGEFACSHPLVNQLQSNIVWGQRGNFLEVPTDCPQRDERLGWTGDAQAFLSTACFNADTAAFFTKWLEDLIDTQRADGAFGDIAPLVRPALFGAASPGWGDAGVIVPWRLYERYGDRALLERCFPAMAAWVDYVAAGNPDHLWLERRGMDYGDWVSVNAETPKDLVATAFYAHSADLVARAAAVLGRKEDADRYRELGASIRSAFNDAYVTPTGRVVGHTQTAYALALALDLLPAELRDAAGTFLAADVAARADHLSTGFLGVAHLLPALTATGQLDTAYRLLEQESFPSWLYEVRQGATTVWERWDAWTENDGFKASEMNSFNHYAFGSVGEWLYAVVGGLRAAPGSVGFDRLVIKPQPGGSITSARVRHHTVRGWVSVEWSQGDSFVLAVSVPPNVTAEVWLPGNGAVTEGGAPVESVERDGCRVVEVGAGTYAFRV